MRSSLRQWSLSHLGLIGHWSLVIGHSDSDRLKLLTSAILALLLSFSPVLPTLAPIQLIGYPAARASMVTWDGEGGDGKWSNPANWTDDTLPGEDNVVIFDATSSTDVLIDQPVTIAGLEMIEGYSGTIAQGPGAFLNMSAEGLHQYAGVFTSGADTIDIDGSFSLIGGRFTAPAATLSVGGNFTVFTAGFDPNNGTVSLDGIEQIVFGDITFHNLVKEAGVAQVFEVQAGKEIIVTGSMKLSGAAGEILHVRSSETGATATIAARSSVTAAYLITEDINAVGWQAPGNALAGQSNGPATQYELAEVALSQEKKDFAADEAPQFTLNIKSNAIIIEPPPQLEPTPNPAPTVTVPPSPAPSPSQSPAVLPAQDFALPTQTPRLFSPPSEGGVPAPEGAGEGVVTSPSASPTPLTSLWQHLFSRLVPSANAQTEPRAAPSPSPSSEEGESEGVASPTPEPSPPGSEVFSSSDTGPDLTFTLINPRRHPIPIEPILETNEEGKTTLTVPTDILAREGPGAFTLTVSAAQGTQNLTSSQDFTWGVLAMNLDRSTYEPGQYATIAIGALDNFGHTLCDAKLTLTVTDPAGRAATLSTDDGSIDRSPECGTTIVTHLPDYSASYQAELPGDYQLALAAETKNGQREMTGSFESVTQAPFVTSRRSSTRIYPWQPYPMQISVSAAADFKGHIVEQVPESFAISDWSLVIGDSLVIGHWSLVIQEGKQYLRSPEFTLAPGQIAAFSYKYDAPNASPQFYLLGPLELRGAGNEPKLLVTSYESPTWAEPRAWQIAADATMDQPLIGGNVTLGTSSTVYMRLNENGQAVSATEAEKRAAVPANVSGSIKNLKVYLSAAPGGSANYALTLMVDGAASALSCTVSGASTDCSDTDEITLTEKQYLSLRSVPTGGPAVTTATFSVLWEGTNAIVPGGTLANAGSGTGYEKIYGTDRTEGTGTRVNRTQLNATAGTLQNLYVATDTNPSPGSYQFNVIVNGSASGITCTISSGTTNCEDATNTKALTGGEEMSLELVGSGSPATLANTWWGIEFVPTTNGESPIWSGDASNPSTSATNYGFLGTGFTFGATESSLYQLNQVFTLRDLYVKTDAAPGSGKSYVVTVRTTDGGDTLLACTVSGTGTTCNDTADDISITDSDNRLSVSFVPSGTPTTGRYWYATTAFITPASSRTRVLIVP